MRVTQKHAMLGLTALAVIATSTLAIAQTKSPAEMIPYRQSQLKNLGGAFKAVNDQAKAAAPDIAVIRTNVSSIEKIVGEFHTWFPAGSGPEAGVKTSAKADIWTNRADFDTKLGALKTGVAELSKAAASGDTAAIGAAAGAAGQACGACHRAYRERPAMPAPPPPPAS